jgi:hypothetical protein
MDLIHVLRSLLKDKKYLEIREELLMNRNFKLQDKYNKIARVFNED